MKHTRYKNQMLPIKYRSFILLFLLLFLSACAPTARMPLIPPTEAEAQSIWSKFIVDEKTKKALPPYMLGGSLRFGYTDKTHRVTYLLWSNGKLPLRLDIQAGIGANIAKIEETDTTLSIYISQEKKAILANANDSINALRALGMPLPISFLDLSYLLRGNFSYAFGGINLKHIASNEGASVEEKYLFHFENKEYFGSLRLNSNALPLECKINDEWQITIEYDENTPYKVKLNSLIEDYKAILLVKENKIVPPYTEEQLKLILPKGTNIIIR